MKAATKAEERQARTNHEGCRIVSSPAGIFVILSDKSFMRAPECAFSAFAAITIADLRFR
jgi:hypothetical protein